jgi:hypothetical protein
MKIPRITAGQFVVAAGLSILLCDLLLFSIRTMPFTHLHKGTVNDLPLAIVRYIVLFPIFVSVVVAKESSVEASTGHLFVTVLLFAAAHILLQRTHARFLSQSTVDIPPNEEEFPQSLGLRDP